MNPLNLPPYEIKIAVKNGKKMILDVLRRKYVTLTPEEWVRQHFVHYLIEHKNYPAGRLSNEVELRVGEKKLRCDSVLYNKVAVPQMILEYKAPTIPLTQKVFDQITAYNFLLKVDYLIVSNGMEHICCQMDYNHQRYTFLREIPDYHQL
ncbi:MAG: type I restriction enzyme HsdR N-terminal domain-containing protein [Prevotellaceae bacterium]|nr:type I restriction enzyme HsdR N-terminal domain-containing protein [Prevotella sp.]MDD7257076.1 type I restriction enzyme HsdR N-terminal domain-containing protein [Prevotellaceae bacterium]MDY6130445.1 type I restriction enzyme HsdR N-terminal domain-containing protein [Prevotella sp.]